MLMNILNILFHKVINLLREYCFLSNWTFFFSILYRWYLLVQVQDDSYSNTMFEYAIYFERTISFNS